MADGEEGGDQLEKFSKGKSNYQVGDFVYLKDSETPLIAQIRKIWQTNKNAVRFQANWFLRPEQTVHPANRKFYPNEVFKSDKYADYSADDVQGRCWVQHIKDYVRGMPVGAQLKDVYVCESRYLEAGKRMEKIKNWKASLPESIRDLEDAVQLIPHKKPPVLDKVPSPFVDDEESEDEDEEEKRKRFKEDEEDLSDSDSSYSGDGRGGRRPKLGRPGKVRLLVCFYYKRYHSHSHY